MIKADELRATNSCLSKAKADEMLFILLARDEAAPATIRWWIAKRIELGMNKAGDPKMIEAEECAAIMEHQIRMGI